MKSRSRTSKKRAAAAATGPENVLEAGSVPPPTQTRTGFRALTNPRPKGWDKASDALDRVRSISTIFPDFNRASRIGGLPLRRIITIHGPTHGGKSAFVGGLIRSFLDSDNVAAYVDAEHATDLNWVDEWLERPAETYENFWGKRPTSYEETIDATDEFLNWMVAERAARMELWREELKLKKGAPLPPLPPHLDLAGFAVIDSLNKLVPEREIARLKKEGGDAIDKGWGRLRAAFNQAFLDHIVPLLGKAETCLGVIVQEREDEDLEAWEMPKLKGGKASQYDASMIVRVMKSTEVKRGEKESKEVFGFRHKIRVWKSKVGHMDGRWTDAYFHMSNGRLVPPGFDMARDAIEIGKELGLVEASGSWLSWRKNRWNGEHNAVLALSRDREKLFALLSQIDERIRAEINVGGRA